MQFWRNLYRVFLIVAAALAVVIVVRFFMPKFQEERRLRARLEEARQDVRRTAETLRELKLKQQRLREDPRYVEKIAREDLGLAKSGETVFRRTVRCHEAGMDPVPPTTPGYGENFDYSCHHLPL